MVSVHTGRSIQEESDVFYSEDAGSSHTQSFMKRILIRIL